jgi:hypothetical protein
MKRILDNLHHIFTAQVITFVAGLITSVVVQAIFDTVITITEGLLFVLMIILVVYAVQILASLRQEIYEQLLQSTLKVRVCYTNSHEGELETYGNLKKAILSAQERILSVSLSRPINLERPPHRIEYYQAIDTLITNMHKFNKSFKYERILQVKKINSEGDLTDEQIDKLIFDHCKNMMNLREHDKGSDVSVFLKQMGEGVSPISFLVIDHSQVVFLIPPITHNDNDRVRSHIGMGIFFYDPAGLLVRQMERRFDELSNRAAFVKSVRAVANHAENIV